MVQNGTEWCKNNCLMFLREEFRRLENYIFVRNTLAWLECKHNLRTWDDIFQPCFNDNQHSIWEKLL